MTIDANERIDYFTAVFGYHLNFEIDPLIAFHLAIQDYRFVYLDYKKQKPDWPRLLRGL